MSRKLVVDDGRTRRELLVIGTMTVGRDPECEISHGDPRLSRRHAEFRATPDGVVVRDLQSRNGVRVNGHKVDEVLLAPGDVVEVAHLALQLVDESGAAATTRLGVASAGMPPVAIAPPVDDDRTRVVKGAGAAEAKTTEIILPPPRPDLTDDRTRVVAGPPRAAATPAAAAPTAAMATMPDVGEFVIRDPGAPQTVPGPVETLGVQALLASGWGRRVLMQGVLLAVVVFMVTAIPLLAWQARVFGVTAAQTWTALLPPLTASMVAGVMVASLIARTVVRGRER